jgi:phosphoribosyl-AMP cyclohydrolase
LRALIDPLIDYQTSREKEKRVLMAQFDVTTLKFNSDGLIPAIAQDHENGEVLMMAWMNADAIKQTLETGQVTYWSRSRQEFWVKGLTSGNTQELKAFRFDCDRDCILVQVIQTGPACHTNRRNCFYTQVDQGSEVELSKPMS